MITAVVDSILTKYTSAHNFLELVRSFMLFIGNLFFITGSNSTEVGYIENMVGLDFDCTVLYDWGTPYLPTCTDVWTHSALFQIHSFHCLFFTSCYSIDILSLPVLETFIPSRRLHILLFSFLGYFGVHMIGLWITNSVMLIQLSITKLI